MSGLVNSNKTTIPKPSARGPNSSEKQRSFARWKKAGTLAALTAAVVVAWHGYHYTREHYPIWEATVYTVDDNALVQAIWKKKGTEKLQRYARLLHGIVNTNNREFMKKLAGLKIILHSESEDAEESGGLEKDAKYEDKTKAIHIYPTALEGAILHEILHFIYKRVLTEEERERFNSFAERVYNLAMAGEKERKAAFGGRYNEEIRKYLNAVYSIDMRMQRFRFGRTKEEYMQKVYDEMFAAIMTNNYGIAGNVAPLYEKYLNNIVVTYLLIGIEM